MAASITVARLGALLELDLAEYRKSLKTAKTEGDAAAQTLGQQIRTALTMNNPVMFGGKSAVGNMIADLRSGIPLTRALQTASASLGGTLKGLSVNALHSSLNGVKNILGGLKGAVGSVFQGLGIGAGIVSFQAIGQAIGDVIRFIPDLIEKGKEYGSLVDQIGDATGATAQQSSRLAGTLLYLGAPVSGIIALLGQMARNLEGTEKRLNALGVATRDANKVSLNQVQILENARHAFQAFGDGTAKAKEIAVEFGRGGLKILVDYLKLTDEQARIVTEDLQKQGLILTESQRNLAETATRESARFQNALTGLGVVLFTTVGPQIDAFFSNLTDWIESHVADIQTAVSSAISFILGLVSTLLGAGDSLDSFSASLSQGNAAASPYSAGIAQLTSEIADLGDTTDKTTDSTKAQRKAIDGQIKSVDGQVAALKKLETQQDKTYTKALAAITKVLDAEGKLLDTEDAAAAKAERDLALTEALRQAKIGLFEAQAQLRKDAMEGKSTDQDALNIAKAQQAVLDAQKAIGDEAASRSRDQRRAELDGVKEYIASVAKLLEDADNKKAALATLKKRDAVLSAREQAQIAAGDLTGAADTHAKIEALKTTETKAQQEIRNGLAQTALEKQKAQLQEELSNVTSTAKDATAIKRAELTKQLNALIAQEAAWAKLTGKERDDVGVVTAALNTPSTGLVAALNDARDAGKDLGKTLKEAFGGMADIFANVFDLLTRIGGLIGGVVDKLNTIQAIRDALGDAVGRLGHVALPRAVEDVARPRTPEYATGLWNSPKRHLGIIDRGEAVLPPSIAAAFRNAYVTSQAAMGMAGGGAGFAGGVPPHSHDVYMDGRLVSTLVDRELGMRSRR